jgi:hypothetical protein
MTYDTICRCGAAHMRSNAPVNVCRVPYMAFERYRIRQSLFAKSDAKPISVYSLHPTLHSLYLIVIEPQMWGWAPMANCRRGSRCRTHNCVPWHNIGTHTVGSRSSTTKLSYRALLRRRIRGVSGRLGDIRSHFLYYIILFVTFSLFLL